MNNHRRNPDETGTYIEDENLEVNVWVNYTGRCHGSDDFYDVYIETTDGKFVKKFNEIYSRIPSFIIGGKSYYKGR